MTLVIGHAGAAGEAPENTLAGVRRCLEAGAEAMEIDVQLTADGVPALLHDETLDRTTNLRGPVRRITSADLARADAGGGEPVPTLAAVLELVAGRLTVFCELKATGGDTAQDQRLVDGVIELVESMGAQWWVAVQSFQPAIVERSRERAPRISTALISPAVSGERLERLLSGTVRRGAQAVSLQYKCVDGATVVAAKRRQLSVWAWTPDREGDWGQLVAAGVDGIITNYPGRLRAFLAAPPGG